MPSKAALRRIALARRSSLQPQERQDRNAQIRHRLTAVPEFASAKSILFYVSFGEEVDTHELMKGCFGRKTVLVPRVEGDVLHVHEMQSLDDLQPGSFGILEPAPNTPEVDPSIAEIVVVPGAAFDLRGNRIGYGKGYYDRLLEGVSAVKIGLAFDRQMMETIPVEDHDIPMDILVTNERLLDFRSQRAAS
ncbi:MAG: 5-formyltetrahydrofolate cyclo-ligase [Verrucomicrobiota bacterium]